MSAVQFFIPYDIMAKPGNLGTPNGTLYVYATDTLNPLPVYATSALTTQLSNPVVADGAGRLPPIYLDNSLAYRVRAFDKDGALLLDRDPYIPGSAPDAAALAPYQAACEAAAEAAALDAANVAAVLGHIANIDAVAADLTNINAVQADLANINAMAADLANLNIVAGAIANVNLTGGSIANVNAVAADLTALNAVAADLTNLNLVAADIANLHALALDLTALNAVQADLTNINAVAGDLTNLNTVASGITAINTVATNIAGVNTTAANIAAILDAPNQAAIATTQAGIATAVFATVDQFGTDRERYLKARAAVGVTTKRCLIQVLLGQSLCTSRGTTVLAKAWPGAYMPVDGCAMVDWRHSPLNLEHSAAGASLASWVSLQEGAGYVAGGGQSPCVGIAAGIAGGKWERAYIVSVAIGSRKLGTLMSSGPRANLQGALRRAVLQARADGYEPDIAFYTAHGEADAVAATGEATYYSRGLYYYGMAQMYAAMALGKPSYVAPVFFTYPVQMQQLQNDRDIKSAIKRIARDLPNGVDLGTITQWPMNTDVIHPTDWGFVWRGEYVGRAVRQWFEQVQRWDNSLKIVDVTLHLSTAVVYFDKPIVRDASLLKGTALAGTDGFEWLDNGSAITINSIAYAGCTATLTLASTPVGTIGQQVLRIAEQDVVGGSLSVPAHVPSSNVRVNDSGWTSPTTPAQVNYTYAAPQNYTSARAV